MPSDPRPTRRPAADRRFLLLLVLLTVAAWLLRTHFILSTEVEAPFRGDVRQYVAYAWNLLHHGVFSNTWPGEGTPLPDTFRSPGYPVFLLPWMAAFGSTGDGWYWAVLHAQALLGASTVPLVVLLGVRWLPRGPALAAGVLVALWPHHVAATGALLGEVLFGFLLALALLLTARAWEHRGPAALAAAGLAWSGAALVNPVSLLFPVLVAPLMVRTLRAPAAAVFVAAALAGPALWGVRGIGIEHVPPGRAALNLAQGAWPIYHEAHRQRILYDNAIAKAVLAEIDAEARLVDRAPAEGLAAMAARMRADPARYLRWYALEKPYLLWDWGIRLGAGGVHWQRVRGSPFDPGGWLHAPTRWLQVANPAIFAASALASLLLLAGALRRRAWAGVPAVLVAAFCVYATLVHGIFQAEPRYAIPYRPLQVLMLVTAGWLATGAWRRWHASRQPGPETDPARQFSSGN